MRGKHGAEVPQTNLLSLVSQKPAQSHKQESNGRILHTHLWQGERHLLKVVIWWLGCQELQLLEVSKASKLSNSARKLKLLEVLGTKFLRDNFRRTIMSQVWAPTKTPPPNLWACWVAHGPPAFHEAGGRDLGVLGGLAQVPQHSKQHLAGAPRLPKNMK